MGAKYVRNIEQSVQNFNQNNIFKRSQNKLVEMVGRATNPQIAWITNYLIFSLSIYALKRVLQPVEQFLVMPILGLHWLGGIVGVFLQGKSDCPAQINLEQRHPYLSPVVGFVNGLMCCVGMSYMTSLISYSWLPAIITFFNSDYLPQPSLKPLESHKVLSSAITSIVASKAMCKVESVLGGIADVVFPATVNISLSPKGALDNPNEDGVSSSCCARAGNSPASSTSYLDALLAGRKSDNTEEFKGI
jgi:hypothetical protein